MTNGLRVLIFEDDDLVRGVVEQICRRRGYEVASFSDARGVCSACSNGCLCKSGQRCADIILSDIKMPGVTGIELLERLSQGRCCVPKMALMSGYWPAATLEYASSHGIEIFHKPVGIWDIDRWLVECEESIGRGDRELVDYYKPSEKVVVPKVSLPLERRAYGGVKHACA